MRKSKLVVAIGAAVALAAAPLMTATASSAAPGGNSGGAVTRAPGYTAPAGDSGGCTQLMAPADYPANTVLSDLSGFSDFSPVTGPLGRVKSFVPTLEKRSVPGSWATWGSPPDTETDTPHIAYTAGATSITLTLKKKGAKTVGMEVEPNPFAVHTFTAVYTSKGGGASCTISRSADGSAGARVLAATATFKAKTVTVSSDVDFAIAAIRAKVN